MSEPLQIRSSPIGSAGEPERGNESAGELLARSMTHEPPPSRRDHPDRDDEHQLVNHRVRLGADGELTLETVPRASIPDHLEEWARDAEEVDTSGRLLE